MNPPLLVRVVIVPAFDTPAPPAPPAPKPPFPPLICRCWSASRLSRRFEPSAARAAAPIGEAAAAVSAADRLRCWSASRSCAQSVRHARAARPAPAAAHKPPFPPLIVPLLVRVAMLPAFDRPAPPAPSRPRRSPPAAAVSALDRPAVDQRRDRAGIRHARAAARTPPMELRPPFPPLILPLLVSLLIVRAFETPAPTVPAVRRRRRFRR